MTTTLLPDVVIDSLTESELAPRCEANRRDLNWGPCPNAAEWILRLSCTKCKSAHTALCCDRCKVEMITTGGNHADCGGLFSMVVLETSPL